MRLKTANKNDISLTIRNGGHIYFETGIRKLFLYNKNDERIGTVRGDTFKRYFLKDLKIIEKTKFGEIYILKGTNNEKNLTK